MSPLEQAAQSVQRLHSVLTLLPTEDLLRPALESRLAQLDLLFTIARDGKDPIAFRAVQLLADLTMLALSKKQPLDLLSQSYHAMDELLSSITQW